MPINDDYMDMIKSKVADIKNLGIGRAAGTITAAAFLANAVGNVPWVHLILQELHGYNHLQRPNLTIQMVQQDLESD